NKSIQEFLSPFKDGAGYEMAGVEQEHCYFVSSWKTKAGMVYLGISKTKQVRLTYEDEINSSLNDIESKSNALNDL
ncbi:MAG: hypothetical protein ACRDCN_01350, partial [Tannerellaceae bacterium]